MVDKFRWDEAIDYAHSSSEKTLWNHFLRQNRFEAGMVKLRASKRLIMAVSFEDMAFYPWVWLGSVLVRAIKLKRYRKRFYRVKATPL